MNTELDSRKQHRKRSDFIRHVVQGPFHWKQVCGPSNKQVPKAIVQFWHDTQDFPEDVQGCVASWSRWRVDGYRHHLFDYRRAKAFIDSSLGSQHTDAFERCYHPAMQSDYFRLCFILVNGGLYVDADDVCVCDDIGILFNDVRLKAQPLCYDIKAETMVSPERFLQTGTDDANWIFYFNNNPLIAGRGHPIVKKALQRATGLLLANNENRLPEIQETTGPGNLSKSIFSMGSDLTWIKDNFLVLPDWDSFALSKWPLSYRNDSRNWRLSNQKSFFDSDKN